MFRNLFIVFNSGRLCRPISVGPLGAELAVPWAKVIARCADGQSQSQTDLVNGSIRQNCLAISPTSKTVWNRDCSFSNLCRKLHRKLCRQLGPAALINTQLSVGWTRQREPPNSFSTVYSKVGYEGPKAHPIPKGRLTSIPKVARSA